MTTLKPHEVSDENPKRVPVVPKPSATMLLLRERESLEILMVERGEGAFFGSALVFPGGVADEQDADLSWVPYLEDNNFEDDMDRKLRVAGWRETYEETGLLPNGKNIGIPSKDHDFKKLIEQSGIHLPTKNVVKMANWITPKQSPKRYDTHFFIAALDGEDAQTDGYETVHAEWMSPARALELGETNQRRLLFATKAQLSRINKCDTIEAALKMARSTPITIIEPKPKMRGDRRFVTIPEDAGYDYCEEEIILPPKT